jgi:ATP diphosphatase
MSDRDPLARAASDALVHDPEGGLPRLIEIMRRLRNPADGCPWDLEQSFETIAPYTIEEAYEVADAIERRAWGELKGELGDLLLQVVYHAQIASEAEIFDVEDVIGGIADKMVRRHPHVFGDENRDKSAAQQTQDWERIKAAERGAAARHSALDDLPAALPALTRALKLQRRAARVGFDWPHTDDVLDKIVEEAQELAAEGAADTGDPDRIEDEFGDLLFVVVNLGRHLKLDPEKALRRTNAKFERRFRAIEAALEAQGRRPEDSNLEEMDALWNEAKRAEKG